MKMRLIWIVICALALSACAAGAEGGAEGQATQMSGNPQFNPTPTVSGEAVVPQTGGEEAGQERASDLLGSELRDAAGEAIGAVEDVVFELGDGTIRYVAAVKADVPNVGIPVPWRAFTAGPEGLVLNVDDETLANAPSVDLEAVDWDETGLGPGVEDYWAPVMGEQSGDPQAGVDGDATEAQVVRLSRILTSPVKHPVDLQELGVVEDALLDLGAGRVTFLVVRPDEGLEAQEELVQVPLDVAAVPTEGPLAGEDFYLLVDRDRLTGGQEE